eukprot:2735530-Rhodomonas_salina.1
MLAEVLPTFNSIDSIFASLQDRFQDTVQELDRARASFSWEWSVALGGKELVQSALRNAFAPHAALMTKEDIFGESDDDVVTWGGGGQGGGQGGGGANAATTTATA